MPRQPRPCALDHLVPAVQYRKIAKDEGHNYAQRPEGTRPVDGVEIQETKDGEAKANRRVQWRARKTRTIRASHHLRIPDLCTHDEPRLDVLAKAIRQ